MTKLIWDAVGEKRFEAGVNHGVLYVRDDVGAYEDGVAWNGLTAVNETPSGAESSPQYADNIEYLNLESAERYGSTIEAFTYPDEFEQCDGTATPTPGVSIGQQARRTFGFVYETLVGNDVQGTKHGIKTHLVYGAKAAPSEKAHSTLNDSPEATPFSWEVTTTPTAVGEIAGIEYDPTAHLSFDSTKVDATALAQLKDILFGTPGAEPRLPEPAEAIALFVGTVVEVTTVAPTYNATTDTITIPVVTGVVYYIDGEVVTGDVVITATTVVSALPAPGYRFSPTSDTDWTVTFA